MFAPGNVAPKKTGEALHRFLMDYSRTLIPKLFIFRYK
jgi:hypothetical protein